MQKRNCTGHEIQERMPHVIANERWQHTQQAFFDAAEVTPYAMSKPK